MQAYNVLVDTSKNVHADSAALADSLKTDSLAAKKLWYAISDDSLDGTIDYLAVDSIVYDIDSGRTYIYTKGEVTYQSFYLKSDYIEFNWDTKIVSAIQITDTSGKLLEPAYFKDEDQDFTAQKMTYDFVTQKGKIYNFKRKEGEGFITVDEAKKAEDNSYYGQHTYYTTCDLSHPHYYIYAEKAKIVPNKVAVTGPANLVIAQVPTPVFLPFGIFPVKKGQTSGILIPQYGESFSQGFFLRNGGYYFALNKYVDLALTGDVYSFGSWRLNASSNYAMRYRFRGNFNVEYSVNKYGLQFAPDYSANKGFFVRWSHSQDPKARPNSQFSANVNVGTTNFLQNNAYNASYLTNSFNSSISYNKTFPGSPFSLSAALRHSQNTSTNLVDLTLPDASLNMNRIYPLKKLTTNQNSPLSQFGISYSMQAKNFVTVPDSTLFQNATFNKFENGFSHQFNASVPFKLLKYFTFTPSFSYNENWYFETIRKNYNPDTVITSTTDTSGEIQYDTTINLIKTDTVKGFAAARYYNLSTSLSTKLYGLLQFNGKIKALRHVLTPSLSFSYRPDFSDPKYGYYGTYDPGPAEDPVKYSIFEGGIFSGPPAGKTGSIGLSLSNNLEMKVFSKKDTVAHEKKIKLIENLTIGSSYNLAADSLNLSPIFVSGYTTLFEKVKLNVSGNFDPYIIDSTGKRLNQFEYNVNNRIGRFTSGNVSMSTSFKSARKENADLGTTAGTQNEREMVWSNPDNYIDFNIPWSFSMSYNLRVSNIPTIDGRDSLTTTQTFNFSGDVSISPNWKIQFTSGYDFQLKDFTYTSVDIYRDLHCWEMSFKWIPFGLRRSYMFNINVKASVLQDLKLTRKKDWSEYTF